MKKKILGEIIAIVLYIAVMILCIVVLPYIEDFVYRFDHEDTVWLFITCCLSIIFIFWCPLNLVYSMNAIHNHQLLDKYKNKKE